MQLSQLIQPLQHDDAFKNTKHKNGYFIYTFNWKYNL